jgi:hypothetical protein
MCGPLPPAANCLQCGQGPCVCRFLFPRPRPLPFKRPPQFKSFKQEFLLQALIHEQPCVVMALAVFKGDRRPYTWICGWECLLTLQEPMQLHVLVLKFIAPYSFLCNLHRFFFICWFEILTATCYVKRDRWVGKVASLLIDHQDLWFDCVFVSVFQIVHTACAK